jgi:hypothetical protein
MVSKHKISHVYALTHDDYDRYLPQKDEKYNKILQEFCIFTEFCIDFSIP